MSSEIHFDSTGVPHSKRFGDLYFSGEGGWEETQYVFLQSNDLDFHFQSMSSGNCFCVGELGFGTGLNFLATVDLFLKQAPSQCQLVFTSTELYPLSLEVISQALSFFPQIKGLVSEFLQTYATIPKEQTGLVTKRLYQGRVEWNLWLGDANATLPQENQEMDVWFLDGFSPSKNQELWNLELLRCIFSKTKPGGSLSTYTASSDVRRNLESAGFNTQKRKGFGRKRDMLVGRKPIQTSFSKIQIVGGGISGLSLAWALSQNRNGAHWKLELWEKESKTATRASGNKAGLVYPHLTKITTERSELSLLAYSYTIKWLSAFHKKFPDILLGKQRGLVELISNKEEREWFLACQNNLNLKEDDFKILSPAETSKKTGWKSDLSSFYYQKALCIRPAVLCQYLLDSLQETDPHFEWKSHQTLSMDTVEEDSIRIYCDGVGVSNGGYTFPELPVKKVRGQLVEISSLKKSPQIPVCFGGYATPDFGDGFVLGASFDEFHLQEEWRPNEVETLWKELVDHFPHLEIERKEQFPEKSASRVWTKGRVCYRPQTPDRLPVLGKIPKLMDPISWMKHKVRYPHPRLLKEIPRRENVYVLNGMGSRGLLLAPFLGRVLAGEILGLPSLVSANLRASLDGARFLMRSAKRGISLVSKNDPRSPN